MSLKEIDKTRNYFIEEIKQNELKNKMICKISNYTEYLLILASAVTGFVSISAFAFLVGVPASTASSKAAIKICVITAGIKKCKSIIKRKEKN